MVSDPDGVLADEAALAALTERGFALVKETDPVALRHRIEQLRPFSAERPVVVVTAAELHRLPYDLWQQGQRVTLALHEFFPTLAYPVVRVLTPGQRERLSRVAAPAQPLGRQASIDFLMRHVFEANGDRLREPASLIAWLNTYHRQGDPMPPVLLDHLLVSLRAVPAYAGWPLEELLADPGAFDRFVREQWRAYVQQETGQLLGEAVVDYLLMFDTDGRLQDSVAGLVRSGALEPIPVEQADRLPRWARPALLAPDEDLAARRTGELLAALGEQLAGSLGDARWPAWQAIARAWAELDALVHASGARLDGNQRAAFAGLREQLDGEFLGWLRGRYAALGVERLPVPHHVHHVPHFIAYERRQVPVDRVALVILDGMSLADWLLIGTAWRARHPDWRFEEQLLLAQIPTITAISRQALVSGLRPADFADSADSNRAEPRLWAGFWAREGLPAEACGYASLALEDDQRAPVLSSGRLRAVCLLHTGVDDIVHGASLGAVAVQAALRVWIETAGRRLEQIIAALLEREFALFLTSDHGHVEARGTGQPSEGLLVETRSRRARIYRDRGFAEHVRRAFGRTILWGEDGLLPDDLWTLMPEGRDAFATFNETVVSHGGLTIEEVVVPLVRIGSG